MSGYDGKLKTPCERDETSGVFDSSFSMWPTLEIVAVCPVSTESP